MSELKPCPFCGGAPKIVTRDVEPQGDPWYGGKRETFVLCACGACLFDGDFHEGFWDAETRAVEAWNRRAEGIGESRREPLTDHRCIDLIVDCGLYESKEPLTLDEMCNFIRTIEAEHGITPQAGKESGE